MISIQNKLSTVKTALLTVLSSCYHYRRPPLSEPPYLVWSEDSEDESLQTDNHKSEQQIHGTIDYFTLTEFDSTIDSIQTALDAAEIGFRLDSVLFEDETNLIHYSWEFWV